MRENNYRGMMSESKFYEAYSRYLTDEGRYETWEESVDRVMDMHKEYYKDNESQELTELINEATTSYKDREVLGAQRALQFGGEQLIKKPIRLYNCVSSHCNRPEFFGEYMYMLLCGAGAGFSVQYHHVNQLPKVVRRSKQAKTFVVEDSIEGWAQAFDVLLSSYFEDGGKHKDYKGNRVYFDLNKIRPRGAYISGGFKAPGSEPLRKALGHVEQLLNDAVDGKVEGVQLKPIQCYDICMHMADAVIAGGKQTNILH